MLKKKWQPQLVLLLYVITSLCQQVRQNSKNDGVSVSAFTSTPSIVHLNLPREVSDSCTLSRDRSNHRRRGIYHKQGKVFSPAFSQSYSNSHSHSHHLKATVAAATATATAAASNSVVAPLSTAVAAAAATRGIGSFYLTRILFLRGLAFVYFIAFLIAYHQNKGLIGDTGITPGTSSVFRMKYFIII